MAVNPGIQAKAQSEIDRVVGRNRLPDFSDRPMMPYVEAIYREVLRSKPPVQIAAHCLTEDDHYKEYFIPKGRWSLYLICPRRCLQVFLHPTIIGAFVIGNI